MAARARWKIADAKNRLSELLNDVERDGPQEISRRGKVFIVVSQEEYWAQETARPSFKDWLLCGPDWQGIDVERDSTRPRDIAL
jgi:prevent-host-death family protein